jgi:hypothetical protein
VSSDNSIQPILNRVTNLLWMIFLQKVSAFAQILLLDILNMGSAPARP